MIKPKFWDLKKQSFYSVILYPLTFFTIVNNYLIKISRKEKFKEIFSICIGNIYLGGTGKTPLALKIYEILSKLRNQVVIGKKYYSSHKDEIKLLKKKTTLIIAKKRKLIIKKAIKKNKKIIIFDDGLQEKDLEYDLKIACFDSSSWIGNGNLIPAGPLRERISSIKKFDAIFLKNIFEPRKKIIKEIKKINPLIKVFNTSFEIINLKKFNLKDRYLIFSGIGNPNNFYNLLKKNRFIVEDKIIFPDHYKYSNKDISEIIKKSKKKKLKIITTEKDYTKIPNKYHKNIMELKINLIINEKKKFMEFLNEKI